MMLKPVRCTAVLLSALLVLAGATGAAAMEMDDVEIDLDGRIQFGTVDYEDTDANRFDSSLMGFRVQGTADILDLATLRASYLRASHSEAVPLRDSAEDVTSTVDGALTSSRFDLTARYKVTDFFNAGLGYLHYAYRVEGPPGYSYTADRTYTGPMLALSLHGNPTQTLAETPVEGLTASADIAYTAWLWANDEVVGAPGHPDLSTATAYGGAFWEVDLGVGYEVYEDVSLQAGYHYTVLSGDGDPGHTDDDVYEATQDHVHTFEGYRFLGHDYKHHGFHLGVRYSF